jgi:hypothetical protein
LQSRCLRMTYLLGSMIGSQMMLGAPLMLNKLMSALGRKLPD